jgi:MATE family multidrug resistance protein
MEKYPESAAPMETDSLLTATATLTVNDKTNKATTASKVLVDSSIADDYDDDYDDVNPWTDAKDTIRLGFPIFLAGISFVGMKLTDSALLGHVSAEALAAASLSDLWTMCTAVLIQGQVLGVLTGAAIGAGNPKLAGIYLQVSYVVLGGFTFVVMLCWYPTGPLWKWMGSDPHVSDMAGNYAQILAWSLPAQVAFGQLSQFFSSQRIMHPEVTASSAALFLNLTLGLLLVLGFPLPGFAGYGFPACPMVTTSVEYLQFAILWYVYVYRQKLHQPCWGGWKWHAITQARVHTFCNLYVPAALGMASDFWRVAVIGIAAAELGETPVAVFNTSYRIMWVVLIAISALSSAAGIKVSLRLGRNQGAAAQQAGKIGIYMAGIVLLFLGMAVWCNVRHLGRIFTDDTEFLQLLEEAAFPFTIALVLMNFSVALERLPYAMGRTTEVFWYGFVASWGFQVPAVYALTTYWRNDLTGLYTGMAIGYAALVCLYGWLVSTSDWDYYAIKAVERAEMPSTAQQVVSANKGGARPDTTA